MAMLNNQRVGLWVIIMQPDVDIGHSRKVAFSHFSLWFIWVSLKQIQTNLLYLYI